MIVDSQIHLWKASTPERPWVAGARPQLPEPFSIERLVPMMDEAGVDRVVIVPPALEGERLDYAQEAVTRYPGRFAIMARVALDDPPLYSSEPYPFRDVTPYIRRLFDAYGPQRCHWGTDITNSLAKATYRQRVTQFTEELDFLSEEDKDWIMGRAILARLGWT